VQPRHVARHEDFERRAEGQERRRIETQRFEARGADRPQSGGVGCDIGPGLAAEMERVQNLVQPFAVVALLDFGVELVDRAQAEHALGEEAVGALAQLPRRCSQTGVAAADRHRPKARSAGSASARSAARSAGPARPAMPARTR
jgi:hypothetical protein